MARRPTKGAVAPDESRQSAGGLDKVERPVSEPRPLVVTPTTSPPSGRLVFLTPDWLPLALVVGDALIAAASVPAGYWIKYGNASQTLPFGPYLAAIPVVVVLYLFSLSVTGQYRSWRGRTLVDQLFALYSGIGLAAVLMFAAIEAANLGQRYSRLTILPAVLLSAVLMTGERYLLRQYETRLRRQGIGTERVLMVGTGEGSEMLIRRMSMFPQYGFHVVGVASDEFHAGETYFGVPVVGRVEDLPNLVTPLRVDQVFLALPASQRDRLLHLIALCEDRNLEFKIVPDLLEVMSTRASADALDGLPLVGVRRNQLRGSAAAAKRLIDVLVSSVLLVLFSPVLLVIVILMKLTMPGPILFRQERVGRLRRPFVIYKFRSMVPDAEAETGPVVAKPGDSRVTNLGRILRRLSLDELPQLYNVLRGDMSLVGPRPQPTFFDERYAGEVPRYLERQQVRPGLTGWAEVNDLRGAAPISDRTMYDVYYIENWSLALDLKCIVLTGLRMFSQRHAY
jgi:exopolysaccharide biosynthesis polyprenyl glycosylphosphotransferase